MPSLREVAGKSPVKRVGNVSVEPLPLPGSLLLKVRHFADARGVFAETYNRREFAALGVAEEFVQDNWSRSERAGTVRGLHFQRPPFAQGKLVRVLRGRILDVAVDLRRSSRRLGHHVAVELAAGDGRMLYVPPGFAHGFQTLVDETEVFYQVSEVYAPASAGGVRWDDPAFSIVWPETDGAERTIIARDREYPDFAP